MLAGIHPLRPASELSDEEISRLRDGIVTALSAAVALYDKSRSGGRPDPPTELNAWTIPRKAGDPCPRCERPIDAIRVRGRGTCFCRGCQG
jgi:formamidopyrimidine-DNA glycosylase